jgi:hypothetical protein
VKVDNDRGRQGHGRRENQRGKWLQYVERHFRGFAADELVHPQPLQERWLPDGAGDDQAKDVAAPLKQEGVAGVVHTDADHFPLLAIRRAHAGPFTWVKGSIANKRVVPAVLDQANLLYELPMRAADAFTRPMVRVAPMFD